MVAVVKKGAPCVFDTPSSYKSSLLAKEPLILHDVFGLQSRQMLFLCLVFDDPTYAASSVPAEAA